MSNFNVNKILNEICQIIVDNLPKIQENRYRIELKSDNTPVTKSDIYIEDLVHSYLKEFLPNICFIGEESFDFTIPNNEDYIVILDPIDGTENFSSGLKEWGVSFGLWRSDRYLGSFILLPELELKLISGDFVKPYQSRIIGLSSSVTKPVISKLNEPGEYRIMGCAVYNIYNVIHGSFYRFVNPEGAYVWDFLPGIMLALQNGCQVKVNGEIYNGEFLDPRRKYCIDIINNHAKKIK
ncbi:inositol monophosphatase family protein [Tissierella sp. Yu-01]|uniref:inositol monophosphatase family protein n=1 Tax=Tissierella sp. Yu-01 TaxID=3035694 RepID=UPI00240D2009|nr:inositol monophosphatase family protein [Tissierella sp. Yu-01]WFA07911.1 inositol monophosphatase family protein [Tissierella sp. Yu-01]